MGLVNDDTGAQRPQRIDRHHQGITVVHQLYKRAWRIHTKHANKTIENLRIKMRLGLGENHRQSFMRRPRICADGRVAQVVVTVDQRQNFPCCSHIATKQMQRKSCAVGRFVVLRNGRQNGAREPHALCQGHRGPDMAFIAFSISLRPLRRRLRKIGGQVQFA